MLMKLELNTDSEEVVDTLNSTPILISNSIEELKTEVVKYLSKFEIGDVISVSLVRDPNEQEIQIVQEKNEDQFMSETSWSFDD
jgi:predicted ATP-grasp superfamily ATP-dependent carboligase